MTLDSNTTSAAGPSNYYSGLPRLAQGHSSPRLDNQYPYFQQPSSFTAPLEHSAAMNITMSAPISMNMPPVNSSMASIMNPTMQHSRSNNQPNHNINMNFPTTLRSNSWDGQGMLPYQWGMPPAFHDRHRASQPDLGQVNTSSMNFQNQFATNYNNNFNPMNFNQPMYNPSPQLSEMPNPNVPMNFNSTRFGYPDGRSYSLVNSSQPFPGYGKPYDKSSPPRNMPMFGEPAFSDRPHLCQIPNCGRMFKRLEHLKRHHRSIHTHERPYPCRYPKCSKAFSRSDNLAQHMRIHRQDPHQDL